MHLARSPGSFPFSKVASGSVVTIGAFDGLHLGHQRLLDRVCEEASVRQCPSVVMSFEPMPKEYFSASNPPARLTRFRQKYQALDRMGIDIFYCPNFNPAMRNIAADAFIRQQLVHTLNTRHLVIGDDFAFARNREGNLSHLQRAGTAMNFDVEQVSSVIIGTNRVSSTAIRNALRSGDMAFAKRLLGKFYRMSGKVNSQHGEHGSDQLILVARQRRPVAVQGVFAVKVGDRRDNWFDAVAHVGALESGGDRRSDFSLYVSKLDQGLLGEYVDIEFVARLSNEEQFESGAEIRDHLAACVHEANAALAASEIQ